MNTKGISLISLAITIVVIIIIAAIGVTNGEKHIDEANRAKFEAELKMVVEALLVYHERAEIRGISTYDRNNLFWDGVSEKAENTAKIENGTEEDSIKYIMDGNKVPNSLQGVITIENGKYKVKKTSKPKYDWAVEMYSYMEY